MKTAEEWELILAQKHGTSMSPYRIIHYEDIKEIQLDAWKQGMTEAYHLAGNKNQAILKVRDDKKEL